MAAAPVWENTSAEVAAVVRTNSKELPVGLELMVLSQKARLFSALSRGLNRLGDNCKKVLPSAAELTDIGRNVTFYDARSGVDGNSSYNDLFGTGGSETLADIDKRLGGTAWVPASVSMLSVMLGGAFFSESATSQADTIVHEILR